jgi:hypothetical protein
MRNFRSALAFLLSLSEPAAILPNVADALAQRVAREQADHAVVYVPNEDINASHPGDRAVELR